MQIAQEELKTEEQNSHRHRAPGQNSTQPTPPSPSSSGVCEDGSGTPSVDRAALPGRASSVARQGKRESGAHLASGVRSHYWSRSGGGARGRCPLRSCLAAGDRCQQLPSPPVWTPQSHSSSHLSSATLRDRWRRSAPPRNSIPCPAARRRGSQPSDHC